MFRFPVAIVAVFVLISVCSATFGQIESADPRLVTSVEVGPATVAEPSAAELAGSLDSPKTTHRHRHRLRKTKVSHSAPGEGPNVASSGSDSRGPDGTANRQTSSGPSKAVEVSSSALPPRQTTAPGVKNRPDKVALMEGEESPEARDKDEPGGAKMVVLMIFKLAVVLALAYVTILVLKWFSVKREGIPGTRGQMRMVDTVKLSTAGNLHLVELGGKLLLIGSSGGQVSLLKELDMAESAAQQRPEQPGRFAEYLAKYSAPAKEDTPVIRVAGLLRECASQMKERRNRVAGLSKTGGGNEA